MMTKPVEVFSTKQRIVAFVVIATMSTPSIAGLDSAMDGMYSASTSPSAYNSQTRMGMVGGSYTERWPVKNVNVVSFDAPRLDAGCGGLDMYGGSFSFINKDELIALFRRIGQQAKGLLFKLAVDSINKMLGGAISEFQKMVADMNKMLKNTCAIMSSNKDYGDLHTKLMLQAQEFGSSLGTAKGQTDDKAGADAKIQIDPTAYDKTPDNPIIGNLVHRGVLYSGALAAFGQESAGVDPNDVELLLMNITGTEIIDTTVPSDGTCAAGAGRCTKIANHDDGGSIGMEDLVAPEANKKVFSCTNIAGDVDGCIDFGSSNTVALSTIFKGTMAVVNQRLFGINKSELSPEEMASAPGGLVGAMVNNTSMTPADKSFLASTSVPIMSLLLKVQTDRNAVVYVADTAARTMADDLAYVMARSLIKVGQRAFSGKASTIKRPEFYDENLKKFEAKVNALWVIQGTRVDRLIKLNTYVSVIASSIPGAMPALRSSYRN